MYLAKLDFGKSLNSFSNKNVNIYTVGRRELSKKTSQRTDTRIFFLVSHCKLAINHIWAYVVLVDYTRVVLADGDPTLPGSDYINANYISVSNLLSLCSTG